MKRVILETAKSLTAFLQENADDLGVEPEDVVRKYRAQYDVEELAAKGEGVPAVIVFLQTADFVPEEGDLGGEDKTVSLGVGVACYAESEDNEILDPAVDRFEDLQNLLLKGLSWEDDAGQGYVVKECKTASLIDPDALADNVALSQLDLEIEVYASLRDG